jgi:hypothetical protein
VGPVLTRLILAQAAQKVVCILHYALAIHLSMICLYPQHLPANCLHVHHNAIFVSILQQTAPNALPLEKILQIALTKLSLALQVIFIVPIRISVSNVIAAAKNVTQTNLIVPNAMTIHS